MAATVDDNSQQTIAISNVARRCTGQFQRCLATYTPLPGSIIPEPIQEAGAPAAFHANGNDPVSPLNSRENSSQPTIDSLNSSSTKGDLANFTSPFGSPSMNATNLTCELSLVEDQLARFSVWAATLRILRADDTCLDHRLREASDLRDMVAGLLNILTHHVKNCAEIIESIRPTTNSSSSPVANEVEGFHYSLECVISHIDFLYKLSSPLYAASGRSRQAEIIEKYYLHDGHGKEIESHLLETLLAELQQEFPAANDTVRRRLAVMMLYRRKRRLWSKMKTRNEDEGFDDLYVCLFERCSYDEELFESYDSWVQHMRGHAMQWCCASKRHPRFVAATKEDYLHHLRNTHPSFSEPKIQILVTRNARHTQRLFVSCPLCGAGNVEEDMEKHIAVHVRKLSVKALGRSETRIGELVKATGRQSDSTNTLSVFDADGGEFSLLLDNHSVGRMPWFTPRWPQSPDQWLQEQFVDTDKIFERRRTSVKVIKIAVLDTGCDERALHFQEHPEDIHRVEWGLDCLDSSQSNPWSDEDGQGTLVVSLLLKILPRAKIVVVRVGRTRDEIMNSDKNVTKALRWIGSRPSFDVDIVNFSYRLNEGSIGAALRQAVALSGGKMLFFSAANNAPMDYGQENYPSCLHDNVILARSAGVDRVMRNSGSPSPQHEMKYQLFWTLGLNVPCDPAGYKISGCAAATPILAAFAALVIQYASTCSITMKQEGKPPEFPLLSELIRRDNLEWLLRQVGTELHDGTVFVKPRDLFENLEDLKTTREFLELACCLESSSIKRQKLMDKQSEVEVRQARSREMKTRIHEEETQTLAEQILTRIKRTRSQAKQTQTQEYQTQEEQAQNQEGSIFGNSIMDPILAWTYAT